MKRLLAAALAVTALAASACSKPPPAPAAVAVDLADITHLQHAAHTEMATRGLIRDLADRPDVALIALTSQLFKTLALNDRIAAQESVLQVSAPNGPDPVGEDDLDGEVWRRLAARRGAYDLSCDRPHYLGSVHRDDGGGACGGVRVERRPFEHHRPPRPAGAGAVDAVAAAAEERRG